MKGEQAATAREFPSREELLRLALLRMPGGSPRLLRTVLLACGSVSHALSMCEELPPDMRRLLLRVCARTDELRALASTELRFLAAADASLLWSDDTHYPALLAEVSSAPSLLFCRGNVAALARPQLAIVGSRHASPSGLAAARAFAADLAAAGFVITSGLALGIDAMAHEGALAAGGETVAVLGCGADVVYPRRHVALADRIRARGCIVTEMPPGTEPLAAHFPQRNRIISGLSLGVLVVEAAMDSGSLITARFAAEQGREVFAIPGSIHSPTSRGCHQLIREGATLVETSAQIMEALAHFVAPADRPLPAAGNRSATSPVLAADEARLVAAMSPAGSVVDDLAAQTGLGAARIAMLLNDLLLRDVVHALPGGLWQPAAAAASRIGHAAS
ncbi:MAG: DNA-processing protein DprA [Gammaproteobacteria bacterium]